MSEENQASLRWEVQLAHAQDDPEVLTLFSQIFGHEMSLAQWRWKYAEAPVRGIILRRAGQAVAFFGGMPRTVQVQGEQRLAVQNGDSMVHPSERGVFSRQGALFHCVTAYFSQYVGPGKAFDFAFGFPSDRAFRLGTTLGLYSPADRMMALSWSPLDPGTPLERAGSWLPLKEEPLNARRLSSIAHLWKQMRRDWSTHFLPVRNAARWHYRFLQHPGVHYELVLVRQRFTRRALCALALREHADRVEWLDYVGPRAYTEIAVAAARRFAGKKGNKPLTALFSEGIAADFQAQVTSCGPSGIAIPLNFEAPSSRRPLQGELWLMGADADFL